MIELVQIEKTELPELVAISYKNDKELLEKYHVGNFSLAEAVGSTLEMVNVSESELYLTFHKVEIDGEAIGYVINSGSHLYSFSIAIEYRTKEILIEWWDKVKELLGNEMTCLLFSNNTRAIQYLINRGMKVKWISEEDKELKEVLLTY